MFSKGKEFIWVTLLLSLVLLALTGVAFADEKLKIDNVQITCGAANGSWVRIGAAISEKANEYFEGFPINAVPGPGSVANPSIVGTGQAHIGFTYPPFLHSAVKGEAPYEDKFDNLKFVASLTPTVVQFLSNLNQEGLTLERIVENKIRIRLGLNPKGSGSHYILQMILQSNGVPEIEDIKKWGGNVYYASGDGLSSAWQDRHINFMMFTDNVPSAAIEESVAGRGGYLIGIGDGFAANLSKLGFVPFTIQSGTYSGQEREVKTVSLPLVVFAREDIDPKVIYYVTKSIYENLEYFGDVHSSFKSLKQQDLYSNHGLEMHEGAKMYYKEIGVIE